MLKVLTGEVSSVHARTLFLSADKGAETPGRIVIYWYSKLVVREVFHHLFMMWIRRCFRKPLYFERNRSKYKSETRSVWLDFISTYFDRDMVIPSEIFEHEKAVINRTISL